jgi:hypothetical protein
MTPPDLPGFAWQTSAARYNIDMSEHVQRLFSKRIADLILSEYHYKVIYRRKKTRAKKSI